MVSDQANLDAIAVSETTDSREAYRAWLMARQLVALGHLLGYGRFASIPQRILAFAIDLLLVGGGGIAVFTLIAYGTPGGINALLSSLSFNAAIYGFVAVAFFYFAFAEAWVGATIGKALVGIAVRDRDLRRPDRLAAFVRNAPIAPVLVCVGIGAAIAVAIAVKGLASGQLYLPGLDFSVAVIAILGIAGVVVGAVALLGAFAILAILLTSERQRVGDLWAGTWVVREPTASPPVRLAGGLRRRSGERARPVERDRDRRDVRLPPVAVHQAFGVDDDPADRDLTFEETAPDDLDDIHRLSDRVAARLDHHGPRPGVELGDDLEHVGHGRLEADVHHGAR